MAENRSNLTQLREAAQSSPGVRELSEEIWHLDLGACASACPANGLTQTRAAIVVAATATTPSTRTMFLDMAGPPKVVEKGDQSAR